MPTIPQYVTAVVVYEGHMRVPTKGKVSKAVGATLSGDDDISGSETGHIWQFVNGSQVVVRTQGASRSRIEVRFSLPERPDFSGVSKVVRALLPGGRTVRPQRVGLNFLAVEFPSLPGLIGPLLQLAPATELLGAKQVRPTQLQLSGAAIGGTAKLKIQETELQGGQANGYSLDFNYQFETTTKADLQRVLGTRKLREVKRHLSGVLDRFGGGQNP